MSNKKKQVSSSIAFLSDKKILMARSFYLYLIFFMFLFNNIKMITLIDEHDLLKKHIGSARENRYRARQRVPNNIQQQQQQQQSFLSPDLLRARWMKLYNEQNRNNET